MTLKIPMLYHNKSQQTPMITHLEKERLQAPQFHGIIQI